MTIEDLAGVHREIQAAEGEVLLETKDLTVKFGGLVALDSVTFNIRRGEILGLIGPNGAGKTTCFNAITGVYRPSGAPSKITVPELGRYTPVIALKQVVFPAPLGPISPRISPRRMSKVTESSATSPPNFIVKSFVSNRTSPSAT